MLAQPKTSSVPNWHGAQYHGRRGKRRQCAYQIAGRACFAPCTLLTNLTWPRPSTHWSQEAPAQWAPEARVRSTTSCYKPNCKQNTLTVLKVTCNPKLPDSSYSALSRCCLTISGAVRMHNNPTMLLFVRTHTRLGREQTDSGTPLSTRFP